MSQKIKAVFGSLLLFTIIVTGISNLNNSKIISKAQVLSDKDFNPNYLLSDESFATKNIFPHERSIQEYLDQVNSPLRNYVTQGAKASHWIYTAAVGLTSSAYNVKPNLNPGLLLAFLEKEQSLLSAAGYDTNTDPEKKISTAMGFGCPDNGKCEDRYKGFINQLNYGAYQLQYNYNTITKDKNEVFGVGKTIKTSDDVEIVIANAATGAAYRYTPHVFDSGFNLWKVMTDKGWGVSGQAYRGDPIDNSSPNVSLPASYIVTFEDETTSVNAKNPPVVTNIQNNLQDNCEVLFQKEWEYGTIDIMVEKLQECLVNKNVFDHIVTGYFGPVTRAALDKVRLNKNSNTTNKPPVQNYSSNVIVINSDPKPINIQPNPATDNCNQLKNQEWKYGTISDDVEKLQRCMQKLGIFNHIYGATGYFGDVTQKALDTWRKQ